MDALPQDILISIALFLPVYARTIWSAACTRLWNMRGVITGAHECRWCHCVRMSYPCETCPHHCDVCGRIHYKKDVVVLIYGPSPETSPCVLYSHVDRLMVCKFNCWFRCQCGESVYGASLRVKKVDTPMDTPTNTLMYAPACHACGTTAWWTLPSWPIRVINLSDDPPRVTGYAADMCTYSPTDSLDEHAIAPLLTEMSTKFALDPRWLSTDRP